METNVTTKTKNAPRILCPFKDAYGLPRHCRSSQ